MIGCLWLALRAGRRLCVSSLAKEFSRTEKGSAIKNQGTMHFVFAMRFVFVGKT
jgi:hypothetical protein